MRSIRWFNFNCCARGLPKVRTFTDDQGRRHEYGVERVTSAPRLARQFERSGFQTELIRYERLFPNLGMAPRTLKMLERRLDFLPRCAFVHYILRRTARSMSDAASDTAPALSAEAVASGATIAAMHVITSLDVGGAETVLPCLPHRGAKQHSLDIRKPRVARILPTANFAKNLTDGPCFFLETLSWER